MTEEIVELPLLQKPRNASVRLIDDASALAETANILQTESGWFAIDAERASGFKYSNRAYLIQISRGSSPLFLIDPASIAPTLSIEPFEQLSKVLSGDRWILHAATQDLPCLAQLGLHPKQLFDTELGGRLLGLERVGLGAMVEKFLGVRLAKEHSAVDWSVRPLHSDWLDYAALDIDVLQELATAVQAELTRTGKADWAEEEFDYLTGFKPKPPKADKWRGLSGLHEVKDQRQLAVARELWKAREALAEKIDVAPGRIIPDASIVAVAKELPKTRSQLANQKTFIGRASRSYLDTWWDALQIGLSSNELPALKQPTIGIPNHRNWAQKFPEADERLQKLKPVMVALAEQAGMPAENLLTPDYLRAIAWEPPSNLADLAARLKELGARNWQIDYCVESFTAVLASLQK